jgi:hypothetical protein
MARGTAFCLNLTSQLSDSVVTRNQSPSQIRDLKFHVSALWITEQTLPPRCGQPHRPAFAISRRAGVPAIAHTLPPIPKHQKGANSSKLWSHLGNIG